MRRQRLLESVVPLIEAMADRVESSTRASHAELVRRGAIGARRAAERYDPSFGVPFWAYAGWWVRLAMRETA
jgi:DNA-directed RNA polymerase specialized sigma subunit